MADREFEEFRQFFEQLPQHIKAPSNCYTPEARVAAPLLEAGAAAGRGRGGDGGSDGGGGGAAAGDWLTRLEAEVMEARPTRGGGLEGVDGGVVMEGTGEGETEIKDKEEEGGWGGVCARHSPVDVFMAGAVDLQQVGGEGGWTAGWVVVGVNLAATERLEPLVVGRGPLPSPTPGVASLPTKCRSAGARLGTCLASWVCQQDHAFLGQGRRVVLVLPRGALAATPQTLQATTLLQMPPATHPLLGGGLARLIRCQYLLLQQEKEDEGAGGAAPQDVLYRLRLAWAAVTPEKIRHAFKICGAPLPPLPPPNVPSPTCELPANLPPNLPQVWGALATLRKYLAASPHATHGFAHLAALHAFCRGNAHSHVLPAAPPEPPPHDME